MDNEEYINKITLEYLLNPNMLIKNNQSLLDTKLDKDIKFYRKRISQLTKDMIKGNYPNNDLQIIFQKYASELIYYFKQQDTKDIYQQEYLDLSLNNIKDTNAELEQDIESINNILINSTNDSVPNLENFVKKISVNTSENHIIPQKKNINIKDPKLRVKGVKTISSKE